MSIKFNTEGLIRLETIVGNRKKGIDPLIPVSRSTFLNRVREGKWPQPIRLGPRTVAWRVRDIRALIANFERGDGV